MKKVIIQLTVEVPENYNESQIDNALADVIAESGGQVLDSKEFKEINE